MIRVSFEINTPDLLQNSVTVTGESTAWFSSMVQHKLNLLPACGVPTLHECRVTIGIGTVVRQVELLNIVLVDTPKTRSLLAEHKFLYNI